MTHFLVAVPTTPRNLLDAGSESATLERLLYRAGEAYRPFVGEDHERAGRIVRPSGRGASAALIFDRVGGQQGVMDEHRDWWVVSAGQGVAPSLCRHVRRRGGALRYEQPVWGQYAAVFVERWMDRVTAWNTVPALEAIHYASIGSHILLTNRPLLAALAMAGGLPGAVRPSEAYAREYLSVGYSVMGLTPFEGVRTIPVDAAVEVFEGQLRLIERPAGLESTLSVDHTLEEGAEALGVALTAGMARVATQVRERPLQLRMSGGKDSRLLLGLVQGTGLAARAVTFGAEGDIDVRLARRMVGSVGLPHLVTQPQPVDAADETGRIRRTLFEAGGIPLSEPHTIRYRGATVDGPGEAIMLGQWPLMKGGLARRMTNNVDTTVHRVLGAVSPLVATAAREEVTAWLEDWAHTTPASTHLEKQYLFARQFRSGRYLQAHVAHYDRDAMIAYPISDHEVAAVSDVLTMAEKVSQRALFGALRQIWPEVMAVPLDRSTWPFESAGPDPEWSGPDYAARHQPVPEVPVEHVSRPDGEYTRVTQEGLAIDILGDAMAAWGRPMVRPDVWEAIEVTAAGGETPPLPGAEFPRAFAKFLWRVRALQVWRSMDWMPA